MAELVRTCITYMKFWVQTPAPQNPGVSRCVPHTCAPVSREGWTKTSDTQASPAAWNQDPLSKQNSLPQQWHNPIFKVLWETGGSALRKSPSTTVPASPQKVPPAVPRGPVLCFVSSFVNCTRVSRVPCTEHSCDWPKLRRWIKS